MTIQKKKTSRIHIITYSQPKDISSSFGKTSWSAISIWRPSTLYFGALSRIGFNTQSNISWPPSMQEGGDHMHEQLKFNLLRASEVDNTTTFWRQTFHNLNKKRGAFCHPPLHVLPIVLSFMIRSILSPYWLLHL